MKDNQAQEDDEPGFQLGPGLYLDRLYFQYIPPGPMIAFGADHCGQVWRKVDEPDKWTYTFRNRYYAGPDTDPFGEEDRKYWSEISFHGANALANARDVVNAVRNAIFLASLGKPIPPLETLLIEGDGEKLKNITENNPPSWLHAKFVRT